MRETTTIVNNWINYETAFFENFYRFVCEVASWIWRKISFLFALALIAFFDCSILCERLIIAKHRANFQRWAGCVFAFSFETIVSLHPTRVCKIILASILVFISRILVFIGIRMICLLLQLHIFKTNLFSNWKKEIIFC